MSAFPLPVHRAGPTPARFDDLQLCQTLRTAMGLRYSLRTTQFTFATTDQPCAELSEAALTSVIAKTIAERPDIFSPSHIRPRRLKRIVALLRALCASPDDSLQGLQRFVQWRLRLQPGSSVTSTEAYSAYETDARHTGEPLLSRWEFQRTLPRLIKARWGLMKLHEIELPNQDGRLTKRNGWRGIELTDSTDRTGTTDSILLLTPEPTQPVNNL